jgi:site-specific DNA-methyltransferase (adenine-specific)
VPLIYIDPPFNTGKAQSRTQITVQRDEAGDRTGFGGRRYRTEEVISRAWQDEFDDYLGFLEPRLLEAHRVLAPHGSLYLHLDYREVHYAKVLLDAIFGRKCFINEIIWAYDYGGRSNRRWPAKHDNILFYAKNPRTFTFNRDEVERIPYMAPGLVSDDKRARGKFPTDTWWHTIVSPTGREKTGYPTQKPVGILKRIIGASSHPGELVLDFFAGSGTTGVAALELGRKFCLIDSNPEAVEVMKGRMEGSEVEVVVW